MREILFRGQMRRKGEKVTLDGRSLESRWVQGSGVLTYPGCETDRAIIYNTEGDISKYPVYADTIGQYIGKKDKNGNKIFEGDILKLDRLGYDTVGVVIYDEDDAEFDVDIKGYAIDQIAYYQSHEIEIVGNIYDNPELAKEGD